MASDLHRVFNSLVNVWTCGETQLLVLDIQRQVTQESMIHSAEFYLLTVAGPSRCNECSGTDSGSCSSKQRDDLFCASDRDSLGTTHCGSAVGKYLDDDK